MSACTEWKNIWLYRVVDLIFYQLLLLENSQNENETFMVQEV